MKFEVLSKEAEVTGDIKQNNVGIDTNNINFIVTILSTNLYSKPIESFIRETVSNAWDSHVEAGVTEPVLLELGKDIEENYYCRIQDFGVGLSPERFDSVYRNIGSSTKRGDNNQIGGFGIGRFSALAYNDVVYITSNFDGIQYKYIMYKDGNTISIDLLHEQETDDRNGVQVQVQLKSSSDVVNFYNAIKQQLVYFENLYFVDNTETNSIPKDEFNKFHIKKYKDFLVNDLNKGSRRIDLVLGKVRYPLRIEALTNKYPSYVGDYPISLRFEIGDLEVTPNREEILYSQKNIDKIQLVLDEAVKEIDTIFDEHSNKDFTILSEYIQALQHSHQAPLMQIDGENTVYITIPSNELKITFKGQKYVKNDFVRTYETIMQADLVPVSYQSSNSKLNYIQSKISITTIQRDFAKIYVSEVGNLNNMSKNYIREELENGSRFISPMKSVNTLVKAYFKHVKTRSSSNYSYGSNSFSYNTKIVKAILSSMMVNIGKVKKFSDSSVPQSYIIQKKADEKAKRALRKNAGINWSENVNISTLRKSDRGYGDVVGNSETFSLAAIKKEYQKLTIYDEKGSEKLRRLFNLLSSMHHKINLVEIAPTRMKLIANLQNFVNLKDFMNTKYTLLRQIGTAKLIDDEIPYLNDLYNIRDSLGKISLKLQSTVVDLYIYKTQYLTLVTKEEGKLADEIFSLCQEQNFYDENTRGVLSSNLEMLKQAQKLLLFTEKASTFGGMHIPDNRINVVVDYILARKLFRPDVSAVIKMKNETILNIKKDENNQNQ